MTETNDSQRDPQSASTRVAIIGGGPIGLELAVTLKRLGIAFQVFEAGTLGNTIAWWAPQTRWFSSNERIAIAGIPLLTPDQSKASREQYLTYLRGVATQFDIPIRTHCPVVNIHKLDKGFQVTAKPAGGLQTWSAESVVLAVGGTDHPKRLNIPGEDLPIVDGYLRETHRYFGRRVLVIGGRNSAIEAALRLHHAGAHVALSYRGDALPEDGIKYWLLPEIRGLLEAGRVTNLLGTRPVAISESGVRLKTADGSITEFRADDVLSLIGYEQDKTLLKSAGVHLVDDMQRPEYDPETMQTNVPGLYVAGTATAGTQSSKFKTFLENCHDHVDRIAAHLTGTTVEAVRRNSVRRAYSDQIAAAPES